MARKKILIFSLMYFPLVGGAELAVKKITDLIDTDEVAFDMVTLRYDKTLPRQEKIGNITVYRVGLSKASPTLGELVSFPLYFIKVLYPLWAFFKAVQLHRKNRYNAIWSIMSYAGFPALFFKTIFRKVHFILTLQEGDTIEQITRRKRIRIIKPLYMRIFKKADVIQVISKFLGIFARDMGAHCRIVVVPNGVVTKQFSAPQSESVLLAIGKHLGAKQDTQYIITTSRLVPKNGVDILIASLKYISEHIELIVVGSGPDRGMLEGFAKSSGVERRVHFIGNKDLDEIPKYLAIADVFARPSRSEGLGTSFLEAMAAGLPIVAPAVGGIVDFLKDGETGLICKVNDPQDLADKVIKLIDDNNLCEYIAKNGQELALTKHDWVYIALQMKQGIFDKIPV